MESVEDNEEAMIRSSFFMAKDIIEAAQKAGRLRINKKDIHKSIF